MKIIDLHCDTIAKLLESQKQSRLRSNLYSVDIEKLKKGESLAQFFALFVDQKQVSNPFLYVKEMIDLFYQELEENKVEIALAKNLDDLLKNQEQKKLSAFLTIEEGGALQGKIENLHYFYQLGVRLITLTWNYPNELGYPNDGYHYQNFGLTEFGRECVREMNKIGMIVDVSHLSDQGFYDVTQIAQKPFVASHSNSRSLWENSRNLTDEMIKAIAKSGGVIGLNFAAHFLGENEVAQIDDMIKHLKHIYHIGGIDVLAIGSDFDGISTEVEISNFGDMQLLINTMEQNGFTEAEIEKIAYKNVMRVLKECIV